MCKPLFFRLLDMIVLVTRGRGRGREASEERLVKLSKHSSKIE